jgi:coproporphyrinogen III oxidase
MTKEEIAEWFKKLQDDICMGLESTDGSGVFKEDKWERHGGGGGRTRIMEGRIIEKGGVNFSAVFGKTPEKIRKALGLDDSDFYATGVSIVLHPNNPWIPIIHMNVRYFEMSNGVYWFGGGIDLTPHYIIEEDARFFHQQLKSVCDRYNHAYYAKFKKWADDYFFISHRNETRGIGGIFFDRLSAQEPANKNEIWSFVQSVGSVFYPTYRELVERNKERTFNDQHKQWQYLRRGRYVEFNLVYDKGTKFGLDTDGRTESILMSLPPYAAWEYMNQPDEGTPEAKTLSLLKKNVKWLSI